MCFLPFENREEERNVSPYVAFTCPKRERIETKIPKPLIKKKEKKRSFFETGAGRYHQADTNSSASQIFINV